VRRFFARPGELSHHGEVVQQHSAGVVADAYRVRGAHWAEGLRENVVHGLLHGVLAVKVVRHKGASHQPERHPSISQKNSAFSCVLLITR
jgi:hypothetical protein